MHSVHYTTRSMNSKRKCQTIFLVGLVVVFLSFQFVPSSASSNIEQYKKLTIKMKPYFETTVFEEFRKFNLSLLFKINPTTYIFEFVGDNCMDTLQRVLDIYKHQIAQWEAVRVYDNTIKPEGTVVELQRYFQDMHAPNLVCSNYYGMNISEAWSRGYTGKGVTVGISDVGINTDLFDLQQNIDEKLCMNFVNNSKDVTPEYFNNFRAISDIISNHGNRIASIVAATKGNNFCSAGVAYNATIAALKIFQVRLYQGITLHFYPGHWTASDIMARAFVYNIAKIDIFVNAWTTTKKFDTLDLATSESLQQGAVSGRKGLGVIYLVPAGPVGNGLSNNNNTITVNGVGRHGTIPDGAYSDTSVITSGLGQGNNLTASAIVTTSRNNKCTTGFKGVSAAIAELAGIIALGLEANSNLSLRAIEHLLVSSSEHEQLSVTFSQNAAGRFYHGIFGFGLLNAEKFVTQATKYTYTPELIVRTLESSRQRRIRGHYTQEFKFCHSCERNEEPGCLTTIEHVKVRVSFTTSTKHLKIELLSPSKTRSVLADETIDKQEALPNTEAVMDTVHFWDENAFGEWKLNVHSHRNTDETSMNAVSLTLYGTRKKKYMDEQEINNCDTVHPVPSELPQTTMRKPLQIAPKVLNSSNGALVVFAIVCAVAIPGGVVFLCIFGHNYGPHLLPRPPTASSLKPLTDNDEEQVNGESDVGGTN